MTTVTWDPAQAKGGTVLAGLNDTAIFFNSGDCVRNTLPRGAAGGKWYFEISGTASGIASPPAFGLKLNSAAMPAGGSDYLFGLTDPSDYGYSGVGDKVFGGGSGSAYGSSWGTVGGTYTVSLLWDAVAKTLSFALNGVDQGVAWNSTYLGTLDYYIVAGKTGTNIQTMTANFGQTTFAYSLPAGAKSWDGSQGGSSNGAAILSTF